MAARFVTTTVVALLIVALALLCLGDIVQAAMPNHETTECASRVCDLQNGCGTTPARPVMLPVAAIVAPVVVTVPAAPTLVSRAAERPAVRDRQVLPLAPRSPPVF
jgi:hypothetical protein